MKRSVRVLAWIVGGYLLIGAFYAAQQPEQPTAAAQVKSFVVTAVGWLPITALEIREELQGGEVRW